MREISLTGATGFLGKHLLQSLARRQDVRIRALAHRASDQMLHVSENVCWIRGSLADPAVAAELMVANGTLIHLAHPAEWSEQTHLTVVEAMADAAAAQGLRRVIHCSTAAVVGAAVEIRIRETTPPRPCTAYERIKLAQESAWRDHAAGRFELAIARPTAVFGAGGRNLLKLADAIVSGNPIVNYLRSALFGTRRMHLIHVDCVVSALEHLAFHETSWKGETFIIADDDDPLNNFRDVERMLRTGLGSGSTAIPQVCLPSSMLRMALQLAGRSDADPYRCYDGGQLRETGWCQPCSLEAGLLSFAQWYRAQHQTLDP